METKQETQPLEEPILICNPHDLYFLNRRTKITSFMVFSNGTVRTLAQEKDTLTGRLGLPSILNYTKEEFEKFTGLDVNEIESHNPVHLPWSLIWVLCAVGFIELVLLFAILSKS